MNGLTRYTIGSSDYYDAAAVDQELALYRDDQARAQEITEALRKANAEMATARDEPYEAAVRQLLVLRPLAHSHLNLLESYEILAGLFKQVGECHTMLSKHGVVVRGETLPGRLEYFMRVMSSELQTWQAQADRAKEANLKIRGAVADMLKAAEALK